MTRRGEATIARQLGALFLIECTSKCRRFVFIIRVAIRSPRFRLIAMFAAGQISQERKNNAQFTPPPHSRQDGLVCDVN